MNVFCYNRFIRSLLNARKCNCNFCGLSLFVSKNIMQFDSSGEEKQKAGL